MKKLIALLFALSMLLAGCSTKATQEETKPQETTAATETFAEEIPETKPVEETLQAEVPVTIPQETEPAETEPAQTTPKETQPAETKPAEIKPQETKPVANQTTNTKPTTNQTTDNTKPTTNPQKPTATTTTTTQKPATTTTTTTTTTQKPTTNTTPSDTATGTIYFEQLEITMVEQTISLLDLKGDLSGGYATFTSSDPAVVAVSSGMLRALKPGSAVITATHKGRTASITVTVTRDPSVYRLDLNVNTLTLQENGDSYQMTWYYSGTKEISWRSSDTSVATVSQDGTVYPVGAGVCEIFLSDNCIGEGCTVTVTPDPNKIIATSMYLDQLSAPLYDGIQKQSGDTMSFVVKTDPVGSECYFEITSTDRNIVSYYWSDLSHCNLLFLYPGTATITIRTTDGRFSQSFTITVIDCP